MDRAAFLAHITAGDVCGPWLLEGEEENLKTEALSRLRQAMLPVGLEELNLAQFVRPEPDELIAACETMPLMADRRLIIVREQQGFSGTSEASDDLIQYLGRVPETCALVFYHEGAVDKRKKLTKAFSENTNHVTFSPMKDAELSAWVRGRFEAEAKQCSLPVASRLVFIVGDDTAMLRGEIDKIVALLGERDTVTAADVDQLATHSREFSIFQLVDAVVAGQEERAFTLLRDMQRQGEDDAMILAMVFRQFRLMQMLLTARYEKRSTEDILRILELKDFAYRRMDQQIKAGISNRLVKQSVSLCLELEFAMKSGRISAAGLADTLLVKLFALRRGATMPK